MIWWSLACGLDATACRAMTGRFPPVTRIGGKRAVADHVLEIIGHPRPRDFVMIDADPAIVEFWQAAFGGLLPRVAEIIRQAPLDGEDLWRAWSEEPVPGDPLERIARWSVVQSGHAFGASVSSNDERWKRPGGVELGSFMGSWTSSTEGLAERLARWIVLQKGNFSGKSVSFNGAREWGGLAGYSYMSESGKSKGFTERIKKEIAAQCTAAFLPGSGEAFYLDLATSSPVVHPGDLVTIDPPYVGTTGYSAKLTRERVVELALEAHRLGARVLVHEAEPVIEGPGWWRVELERRHGANQRTWSKQRREVACLNFEPARGRRAGSPFGAGRKTDGGTIAIPWE